MLNPEECSGILEDFGGKLKARGITYFLIYGTCLGAIREKDFMMDDTDIDIGIYEKDIGKVKELVEGLPVQKKILENEGVVRTFRIYYQTVLDVAPFYMIGDKWCFMKDYKDGEFYAKVF